MHERELATLLTEELDHLVDVVQGRHPRRYERVFSERGNRFHKRSMGQHCGCYLVVITVELGQEIETVHIPGRAEPADPDFFAVAIDLQVVLTAQLQSLLLLPLRRPPGTLPRLGEKLLSIDEIDFPFLKLHIIAVVHAGNIDELPGVLNAAVVIDADLGDHGALRVRWGDVYHSWTL